jgi:AcrR family transcriptional regulator
MTALISKAQQRKADSHARIVDVAAKAIRRAGYRGVGVADIMLEAGLTHGGFYAHFASRKDMLIEAMQHAGQQNLATLERGIALRQRKGRTRFAALVETYLHDAHLDRVEDGCIVAALVCEMPREDDAVRAQAQQRVAAMVALVANTLPPSQQDQAPQVTASLVGALQLARALGGKAGRAMLAQTRQALIARHAPSPRQTQPGRVASAAKPSAP